MGWIYTVCFAATPLAHAGHYTGWATDVAHRLEMHAKGQVSKLLAAVAAKGIKWELASVVPGDRFLERQLKKHSAARRCPICLTREVTPMEHKGDWRERAACRDVDPEVFFPLGDVWRPGEATAAKAVCWHCPVSWECLASAIQAGDAWAVAGGMTPAEREGKTLRTEGIAAGWLAANRFQSPRSPSLT